MYDDSLEGRGTWNTFWPLAESKSIFTRHNSYGNSLLQRRNVKLDKLNWDPQSTESLVQLFCWRMSICLGEEAEAARRTITRVGFEANACSLWGQRDRHFGWKTLRRQLCVAPFSKQAFTLYFLTNKTTCNNIWFEI